VPEEGRRIRTGKKEETEASSQTCQSRLRCSCETFIERGGVFMANISEGLLDFKSFEKKLFETMCRVACEEISQYLAWVDLSIKGMRDTNEYRLKDNRETTVKTIFGEVRYSRGYYKQSTGGYTFLLDKVLGIFSDCGLVSANLAEQIVIECAEKSFRKATESICNFTGQTISAMGSWNVVQQYGEEIEKQETRLNELVESDSVGHLGNISAPVLFDEYDDVWISRQKEQRRKKDEIADSDAPEKKIGMKPMHMGIAYTGWTQASDGSFSTANKIAYASFGSSSDFVSNFETLLHHRFDMDGIEQRLTNGDGEQWIKTTAESNDSILQLDPYHRSKAIIKAVRCKEERKLLFDAIAEKDVDKVLNITNGLVLKEQDKSKRNALDKLHGYFSNNRESFLSVQERGIELPRPPEGIIYRNMGVQESSNCSILTQRMKHRRGSWSEKGANNMGKILCFMNTIGLDAILGVLPEMPTATVWVKPLSAAQSPKYDGNGYGADWLYAQMPFEQAFRTQGREAIRNILRMRPLSEVPFIPAPGVNKSCFSKH
jgi:hypothetical protein